MLIITVKIPYASVPLCVILIFNFLGCQLCAGLRIHIHYIPQGSGSGYGICSVADPGSGACFYPWILEPGSGWGKNPDRISESLETIFGLKILKFFDRMLIRDLFDRGSQFRYRNSNPGHL